MEGAIHQRQILRFPTRMVYADKANSPISQVQVPIAIYHYPTLKESLYYFVLLTKKIGALLSITPMGQKEKGASLHMRSR